MRDRSVVKDRVLSFIVSKNRGVPKNEIRDTLRVGYPIINEVLEELKKGGYVEYLGQSKGWIAL